jgi:hypothetical protein
VDVRRALERYYDVLVPHPAAAATGGGIIAATP